MLLDFYPAIRVCYGLFGDLLIIYSRFKSLISFSEQQSCERSGPFMIYCSDILYKKSSLSANVGRCRCPFCHRYTLPPTTAVQFGAPETAEVYGSLRP